MGYPVWDWDGSFSRKFSSNNDVESIRKTMAEQYVGLLTDKEIRARLYVEGTEKYLDSGSLNAKMMAA